MFGLSWSEILIIGIVALVCVGPNDLPRAMKTAARWMSAGRKLAREFQGHVDDLVREAELDELREQARKLAMQPMAHIQNMVDPKRELADALAIPQAFPQPATPEPPPVPPSSEAPSSEVPALEQAAAPLPAQTTDPAAPSPQAP
jgi:sec-independent protein translocase protein TatB